jgi:flagellar hook capping protein FlgD/galactose oxidase-like protein
MRLPLAIRHLQRVIALAVLAAMIPVGALADAINGTWSPITPGNTGPPTYRKYFAASYDPVRERLIVDGGAPACPGDYWALSLAGTPTWSAPHYGATRQNHPSIYDAVRDRLVLFGWSDCEDLGLDNYALTLDLASFTSWGLLATAGTTPAGRAFHSLIYDPIRDRALLFAGAASSGLVNDVWELTFSGTPTWTQIVPAGTPPSPRQAPSAIYDPVRDVMLVFGGSTSAGRVNDVWQLSLGATPTWTALAPAGTLPNARSRHSAIYDPIRDRMVVFGGLAPTGSTTTNDLWALSLAGTPTWNQLAPAGTLPLEREGHRAVYDPPRDRMVVFGGQNPPEDLWALNWGAAVDVEPTPTGSRTMTLRSRPNPATTDVAVEFALPRPGRATLHVYDVRGRLVRVLLDGEVTAGEQRLVWDGRAPGGERLTPGVYMLHLRAGGELLTSRIVLVD